MPDNRSSFSRNYASNAHRSAIQAHKHMAQHGRQAQARQLEQMRARNREASRRTDLEYPGAVPQPRRRRRTGVIILLVLAALAVGAWLVVATSNPVGDTIFGVHATVSPGTEWNVRRGPGTSYRSIGVVQSGQDVTVACAQGSWIKITSPKTGFVYKKGLTLHTAPKAC
jgi:Bacterial SH3 domain